MRERWLIGNKPPVARTTIDKAQRDMHLLNAEVERLQPHNLVAQVDELLALGVEMRREIAQLKRANEITSAQLRTYANPASWSERGHIFISGYRDPWRYADEALTRAGAGAREPTMADTGGGESEPTVQTIWDVVARD